MRRGGSSRWSDKKGPVPAGVPVVWPRLAEGRGEAGIAAGRGVGRVDFVLSSPGLGVRRARPGWQADDPTTPLNAKPVRSPHPTPVPAPVLVAADPDGDHRAPGEQPRTEDIL